MTCVLYLGCKRTVVVLVLIHFYTKYLFYIYKYDIFMQFEEIIDVRGTNEFIDKLNLLKIINLVI